MTDNKRQKIYGKAEFAMNEGFGKICEKEIPSYLRAGFNCEDKNEEKGIEESGVYVSIDSSRQSDLIRDILTNAECLHGRYDERQRLDAFNLVSGHLKLELKGPLNQLLAGISSNGKSGKAGMRTIMHDHGCLGQLQDFAMNFIYDSTPTSRVRGPQTEEQKTASIVKTAASMSPEAKAKLLEMLMGEED